MTTIKITELDADRPVLQVLQERFSAAPKAYLRQLLRRGKVLCDGLPLDETSRLPAQGVLQLPDSRRLRDLGAASLPPVAILLETDACLAVFKPAGLAVHACVGHEADNLTDRLRRRMQQRGEPYRVSPAHRLDIGTSGPVLFGKGRRATAELGRMLQNGLITKTYLALVRGRPPEAGVLTSGVEVQGNIKQAATRFRLRSCHGDAALLELELLSGRKHQIRQQCAAAGWPLFGDRRYGGPVVPGLQRLFLHCSRLRWHAPGEEAAHIVTCPLPRELRDLLSTVGIEPAASPSATAENSQVEN